MNILTFLIVTSITVLLVSTIMSRIFKDEDKKDKGFELIYFKLTYRRKLIRVLWGIPIVSLLYLVIYLQGGLNSTELKYIGIAFFLIFAIEIAYNYVKWKKIEKKA
ncbi:hypothetical protein [Ornithinibacillus californiensis]|uniref:hypothetical protein n=1 Tax=Ornithinibacillus californiensis TaxID=161536 RepID=UPI00064DF718|nr:hypothetical protein [Ornithinibacillus californiensis]